MRHDETILAGLTIMARAILGVALALAPREETA